MGGQCSESSERGVSNVLTVTLLIAITLVGVVIVLAVGWMTIDDTNQAAEIEVAQESIQQLDSRFQQSSSGEASVSVPDAIEGGVSVSNQSTYVVTLNDNPDCTSGARTLSRLQYDSDGRTVAYEGGGVWRGSDSGASMAQPPDINYEDGSLTLSFRQIGGFVSDSDRLQATTDATQRQRHEQNVSTTLYTNASSSPTAGPLGVTCSPSTVRNATLEIRDSPYAPAWAAWATSNFDDRQVFLTTPSSVAPGDDISMTFALGNVSDPYYNVSDLRVTNTTSGPAQVSATVTNVGGLPVRTGLPVELSKSSTTVETRSLALSSGESRRVTFDLDRSDISTGSTDFTVEANNSVTQSVTFDSVDAYPSVSLSSSVPSDVVTGSDPSATVTIDNSGPGNAGAMTAIEQVTMRVDGVPEATWTRAVDPESSTTIDVSDELPREVGEYTISFSGVFAPDSENETVTPFRVGERGYFDVGNVSISDGGTPASNKLNVTARIDNIGGLSLGDSVTVSTSGHPSAARTETRTLTLNGTVGDAENATLSVEGTSPPGLSQQYTYTIQTPNETVSGTVYRSGTAPPAPNFRVEDIDFSANPAAMDASTTVSVSVKNVGSVDSTQQIRITNSSTGTTIDTVQLQLDAGERKRVTQTIDVDSSAFALGDNSVTVESANTSREETLEVRDLPAVEPVDDERLRLNRPVQAQLSIRGVATERLDRDGTLRLVAPRTEMALFVDNDTGQHQFQPWASLHGGDLNHPATRAQMDRGNNPTENVSLDAGTEFSVFPTTYRCNSWVDSGETYETASLWGWADVALPQYACSSAGSPTVTVGTDSNTSNVVILSDGDQLPGPSVGTAFQRTVDEMVDGRVNDSGHLQLDPGQYVFLYELTDPQASPAAAMDAGDPDYNDAVALFDVRSVDQTQHTQPAFRISDITVPDQTTSSTATLDATITNVGGQVGTTSVVATLDGTTQDQKTIDDVGYLSPGESTRVSLDLATVGSPGTYQWTVDVTRTADADRVGFITIGTPSGPLFQLSNTTTPSTADAADAQPVTARVTNTGGTPVTQDVSLWVRRASTTSAFVEADKESIRLTSGESDTSTLSFGRGTGSYEYKVGTEDANTSIQTLYVGQSTIGVASGTPLTVGQQRYPQGTTIQHNGTLSSMSVALENTGSVGDRRDVRLRIHAPGNDTSVFNTTYEGVRIGRGQLSSPAVTHERFETGIGPGYYEYTLTVYEDTEASGTVEMRISGTLFIQAYTGTVRGPPASPITVDAPAITLGS